MLDWTRTDWSMQMSESSRGQDKKPVVNHDSKTFTLVQRTAYMIEDGVPAANILLFTFTKKAANEIADRIKNTIGDRACGVSVSTYHSFCARQLRRYCTYLNYKDNFSIIDDDDQLKIIKAILSDIGCQEKPQDVLGAISKFKEKHLTPSQAAVKYDEDNYYDDILVAYERYQRHLKSTNVMDFDDLLFNMVTILEQNEVVRQQIWNRYKFVVCDEAQDSSNIDSKLIFLLMNPKTRNLCLVGDSDQSRPSHTAPHNAKKN